ncbi:MAG: hypothetical protein ACFFD2_20105 [Promethearchaeota archaeon]
MTAHIRLRGGASPEWSLGTINIGTEKSTNDPPPTNIPYEIRNGSGDEFKIEQFVFVERAGKNFEPGLFSVEGVILEGQFINIVDFLPHTFHHGDDFDLVIRVNCSYPSTGLGAGEYGADLYAYGTYQHPDGLILRPSVNVQWAELVDNKGFIICLGTEPKTVEADGYIGGKADFSVSFKNLTDIDLNVTSIRLMPRLPRFSGPIRIMAEGTPITLPDSIAGQGGIWKAYFQFTPPEGESEKKYYKGRMVITTDIGYVKNCYFIANNYHSKPIMRVEPEELDFGDVAIGTLRVKYLNIFNDGDADLEVSISVKESWREDPELEYFQLSLVDEHIIPPSPDPVKFRQPYAPKQGALFRPINDLCLVVTDAENWNPSKEIFLKGRPRPPRYTPWRPPF